MDLYEHSQDSRVVKKLSHFCGGAFSPTQILQKKNNYATFLHRSVAWVIIDQKTTTKSSTIERHQTKGMDGVSLKNLSLSLLQPSEYPLVDMVNPHTNQTKANKSMFHENQQNMFPFYCNGLIWHIVLWTLGTFVRNSVKLQTTTSRTLS